MKKGLSLILFSALILTGVVFNPIKVFAAEVSDSYYEFVCEGVENYYRNKDLGEENPILDYFTEDILTLLNAKIEMDTFQRQTYELEYKEYELNILPINQDSWNDDGNEIYLELQVERVWYYNDEPTTVSEVLEVTVAKENGVNCIMTGCYNKYESIIYGPIDELFRNAKLSRSTSNTNELIESYIDDYKEQCVAKEVQLREDEQNAYNADKDVELMSLTYLVRGDIKNWARNNYNKSSPTSSTSSVSYYDFSQISGAFDCTNFVSHALLAGGATMHDDGKSGIQGTDQWYYRSTANRSSSWAGVNQLYTFLTRSNPSNSNKGPYATEKELTYANAFTGDIVQGHNGTIWRHSTVVTKFADSKVYVTGRTMPGAYNDNVLATSIYGEQRLLHIEGNYTG